MGFEGTYLIDKEELLWNRSLYRKALDNWHINNELKGIKELDLKIGRFDKIYIGHSSTVNDGFEQPVLMGNVINVDQGCKRKGTLSVWVDETDTFFQNL